MVDRDLTLSIVFFHNSWDLTEYKSNISSIICVPPVSQARLLVEVVALVNVNKQTCYPRNRTE